MAESVGSIKIALFAKIIRPGDEVPLNAVATVDVPLRVESVTPTDDGVNVSITPDFSSFAGFFPGYGAR